MIELDAAREAIQILTRELDNLRMRPSAERRQAERATLAYYAESAKTWMLRAEKAERNLSEMEKRYLDYR